MVNNCKKKKKFGLSFLERGGKKEEQKRGVINNSLFFSAFSTDF